MMPIETLPESTRATLLSTLAIYTTGSLVKELLDNSYDAKATSISVEVSLNTLDVIQVKDDGYGIRTEDGPKVGQRYCTSKLKDIDELRSLGGQSLGFRGEALASAVDVSGSVEVGTRIEGEVVGRLWRIGNFDEKKLISRAPGTTIKITDFLRSIPVRKQTALKETSRTFSNIRRLLQSYALARPATRLSLKILKAKDAKGDWTYAPGQLCSLEDAVLRVMGKDVRGECTLASYSEPAEIGSINQGGEVFKVEAVLPTKGFDPLKINYKGTFLSIDSRPVSCTNGVPKQINALFKIYLRSAALTSGLEKVSIKDPFLAMNISCPTGAYDPNIEPSKNDLLFENSSRILQFVESFLESIYGILDKENVEKRAPPKLDKPRSSGFELLLARRSEPQREVSPLLEEPSIYPATPQSSHRAWRPNMYGFDEGDLEEMRTRPETSPKTKSPYDGNSESEEIARDITLNNPWTMAKMNGSLKTNTRNVLSMSHGKYLPLSTEKSKAQTTPRSGPEAFRGALMLSPESSSPPFLGFSEDSPMPGPPVRPFRPKMTTENNRSPKESDSTSNAGLHSWLHKPAHPISSSPSTSMPNATTGLEDTIPSSPTSVAASTSSFVTAPDMELQTLELDASDAGRQSVFRSETSHFAEHLDYENRKRAATLAARRERMQTKGRNSGSHLTQSSPYLNRRSAASAALLSSPGIILENDEVSRAKDGSQAGSSKSPRKHKSNLPMEKIDPSLATHALLQMLSPTAKTITETVAVLSEVDAYLVSGDIQKAFIPDLNTNRLGTKIAELLSEWKNDGTEGNIIGEEIAMKIRENVQEFN